MQTEPFRLALETGQEVDARKTARRVTAGRSINLIFVSFITLLLVKWARAEPFSDPADED